MQVVESREDVEKPCESQQSVHLYVVSAKEMHQGVTPNGCLLIVVFAVL